MHTIVRLLSDITHTTTPILTQHMFVRTKKGTATLAYQTHFKTGTHCAEILSLITLISKLNSHPDDYFGTPWLPYVIPFRFVECL